MERTGTRERLILAAEMLFGEKGIPAVSLREINLAAGQRNTSASHYHFGSKEALVTAIFDLRQQVLENRRSAMLDSLLAAGQPPSVRSLARVLIDPLAELTEEPGGNYVSFLAQLYLQPLRTWRPLIDRPDEALLRLAHELSKVARLPEPLLANRMTAMRQHVVTCLASYRRWRCRQVLGTPPLLPFPAFVVALVDGVTAYLAAPMSAELQAMFG